MATSLTQAPPAQRHSRPASPSRARASRRYRGRYLLFGVLALLLALNLAPFLIVAMNALKSHAEYAQGGPLALPRSFDLGSLTAFWQRADFGRKLWNTTLFAGGAALLAVLLSIFNAYALGVGRIRGRSAFLVVFLLANLLPQEVLVYPLYYGANRLGLYDSVLAITLVFAVIHSAFGTYLLSAIFAEFPREILDAAAVDGAGRWRTLWQIIIPVSRPSLAVMFTFFFIWTWNEFFLPLIFLISNDNQTVPVALAILRGERQIDVTSTSSAALLGILPAVIFFVIFQRSIARGVMSGAVK